MQTSWTTWSGWGPPFACCTTENRGSTSIFEQVDLEAVLETTRSGLTVKHAARLMFESEDPKANEIEKARRKLDQLVSRELAERRDDPDGLARYFGWFEVA